MRIGRGFDSDRDQKSVERKAPCGFRNKKQKVTKVDNPKQCGNAKCGRWFPRTPDCFDTDRTRPDGLQSYCVECKDAWELTLESRFRRLREFLRGKEPSAWAAWEACEGGAWGEFVRKVDEQGDCCSYCGAGLREWQVKGHNLDRIDNNDHTLHSPENTRLCCMPCNMTRGRKRYHAWKNEVAKLVKEHGWGRVPWSEIDDRFRRVQRRRCAHLAVTPDFDPRQLSLLDLVGGTP